MKSIGIVPDAEPNADAKIVTVPDSTPLEGSWEFVASRLEMWGLIPRGWHLVSLTPHRRQTCGDD